jgi:outer membrane protein assembly factor BamB
MKTPLRFLLAALLCVPVAQPALAAPQDVVTYHGDTYRTGWFSNEPTLTTANVGPSSFGLLQTIALDARVDAEPLVILQQSIQGQGTHDVVYVATENNSVYALDAVTGATLWFRNFGPPVPDSYKNGDDNVYPIMGILSTPVIDRSANAMYVVPDVYNGSVDVFSLHEIALDTGADIVTPTAITASGQLKGGSTWTFLPQYQLQRPALLEANGSIYVSFGSNGDIVPSASRGLILRYNATTLAPQFAQLTNRLDDKPKNPYPFYLSSIWQSGYGPAADENGNILFSTGNSSWHNASYSKLYNRPDSIVEFSGDLTTLLQSFTPSDYFSLDQGDVDVGSGGTIVIPAQPGRVSHLAVAGGKDGRAFLIDRDHFGGYVKGGPDKVLQKVSQGGCWCGPAYFVGSDNVPRVVTGGGNGATIWTLSSGREPQLTFQSSTGSDPTDGYPDDGGVIPVISSNGTAAGSAVMWFVQRPQSSMDKNPGTPVTLWAFDVNNLNSALFSVQAGTWTHAVNSNANIVPTVANGKVYVASNMQLQIFGLLGNNRVRR